MATVVLTVACLLSKGPKRFYDASHVERLCKMVAEHVEQPYRFLCLTNTNEHVSCESLSLVKNWPGWWSKIEFFCPGLFKGERDRVLYLDLDVTITGKLDDLADYPAPFVICRDFLKLGFNSSVMVWDAGYADTIYTLFNDSVMERLTGDQNWIQEVMPNAQVFPKRWCISYKRSLVEGRPADMRVLVYHGDPKPWELSDVV